MISLGCFASLNYIWKNCLIAWQGKSKNEDKKSIILEIFFDKLL
jgi:hypothetical protein